MGRAIITVTPVQSHWYDDNNELRNLLGTSLLAFRDLNANFSTCSRDCSSSSNCRIYVSSVVSSLTNTGKTDTDLFGLFTILFKLLADFVYVHDLPLSSVLELR
jgi:hypothetical protein